MTKFCIAGAAGKMGAAIINESINKNHTISGVIEAESSPFVGKTLKELGVANLDLRISGSDNVEAACKDADVFITFTSPIAEVNNLPIVASSGKKIVLGTTGFTDEQYKKIQDAVAGKTPAVFSPNFSVGVNVLFNLVKVFKAFPPDYDFSLSEIHHTAKKDSPSGTAKKIEQLISEIRNYKKTVYGREGINPRTSDEMEVVSMRIGGVPGIHDVAVAGPYEMLRIEHTAFSRNVFAQGAVFAAEWLTKQTQPKIFSMQDVLNL